MTDYFEIILWVIRSLPYYSGKQIYILEIAYKCNLEGYYESLNKLSACCLWKLHTKC